MDKKSINRHCVSCNGTQPFVISRSQNTSRLASKNKESKKLNSRLLNKNCIKTKSVCQKQNLSQKDEFDPQAIPLEIVPEVKQTSNITNDSVGEFPKELEATNILQLSDIEEVKSPLPITTQSRNKETKHFDTVPSLFSTDICIIPDKQKPVVHNPKERSTFFDNFLDQYDMHDLVTMVNQVQNEVVLISASVSQIKGLHEDIYVDIGDIVKNIQGILARIELLEEGIKKLQIDNQRNAEKLDICCDFIKKTPKDVFIASQQAIKKIHKKDVVCGCVKYLYVCLFFLGAIMFSVVFADIQINS